MHIIWHGLMANLAVVTLFVTAWTQLRHRLDQYSPWVQSSALGLLFGLGAIAAVMSSLADGIELDLRTTLVSAAGLFGGPIAGLTAGVLAVGYRLQFGGGVALSGCVAVAVAVVASLLLHRVTRNRPLRRSDIVVMAVLVAAGGVLDMMSVPVEYEGAAMSDLIAPNAALNFLSNLLAGLAMLSDRRRHDVLQENQTYRTIIEALPDSLNIKDCDGHFIVANQATAALMQAGSAASLIGKTDADFYAPPVAAQFREDELAMLAKGEKVRLQQLLPHLDGQARWLSTLKVPLFDERGEATAILTHNHDITEVRTLMTALEASQQQLSYAIAQMADGVAMFGKDGRMVFCNEQYRNSFPLTRDVRIPGTHIRTMLRASAVRGEEVGLDPESLETWIEATEDELRTPSDKHVPLVDGRWVQIRTNPSPDGTVMVVVSDISKIKATETNLLALTQELHEQALTDGLTGILNRRAFDRALEVEVARSGRADSWVSLLMLDIDRFKAFNDTYGHQEGDACLRAVSAEFVRILKRPDDVVARYGGEEFAVILPATDEDGAFHIADQYLRAVRALNIAHAGSEKGVVTVSIGMACYRPGDQQRQGTDLVRRADRAMYDAKLAGRDRLMGWRERQTGVA